MSGRVFDGRIAEGIAPDDRARQERLKATARALVTAVRDGLVRDGAVRLHGFGTFRLRPVAARRGRHPRTGEPIDIPAGWRVMFRPAKALRERIEPDRAPALPIGEPHASREAMLAASAADAARNIRSGAGRIPAQGIAAPPPMAPDRVAAAAMPERKFTAQGPVPQVPADLEWDSRVTRSPAALMRAPTANEPPAAEEVRTTESAPTEPPSAPVTARRRIGYRYALVLLLVLLVAGLAWLLRPFDSPVPRVAEEPEPVASGQMAGNTGSATPDPAAMSGGAGSREPESAATATEQTDGPGAVEGDAGAAKEMAEADPTASADGDAPAASGDTGATDGDGATVGGTVAEAKPAVDPGGSDAATAATPEMAKATSTATTDRDDPESPGDAGAVDEGGAVARETVAAGTGPTSGQAGADAEVRATSSEAAEETAAPPSDPAKAAGGMARDGDPGGEAARDAGATPDAGDSPAAGTEAAQTATVAGDGATGPAAEAPSQGQAVSGTRAADEGAAESGPYFQGRDYTVRSGDTLWDLADRQYVNPYYWPHIWNHNTDIENPDRLEVRQGLWLPTLEGEPRSLTEADRRSIAEGYLLLYRFFREQGDANPQYALVGVRYFDASVLPERLRGTAAGYPGDTLAAVFQARLEAEFPLD
ncbi:HU family DNA-binding protein [Halofilum ochraceum]|uniref:HU family DNA-binding protein n=1 Tax=Halofilum ochraceum TaxID=1611323 RepID=UPI000830FE83|nr:HU family DNA-binding protein [Halofilum ochraceum]